MRKPSLDKVPPAAQRRFRRHSAGGPMVPSLWWRRSACTNSASRVAVEEVGRPELAKLGGKRLDHPEPRRELGWPIGEPQRTQPLEQGAEGPLGIGFSDRSKRILMQEREGRGCPADRRCERSCATHRPARRTNGWQLRSATSPRVALRTWLSARVVTNGLSWMYRTHALLAAGWISLTMRTSPSSYQAMPRRPCAGRTAPCRENSSSDSCTVLGNRVVIAKSSHMAFVRVECRCRAARQSALDLERNP